MYAKCVSVRDKQLLERKGLHEQKKAEEKRKDLMIRAIRKVAQIGGTTRFVEGRRREKGGAAR